MLQEIRLALLGFGSANQALVQMLLDKSESSSSKDVSGRRCLFIPSGNSINPSSRLVPWRIVCIITRRHGQVRIPLRDYDIHSSTGHYEVDAEEALSRIKAGKMLDVSLVVSTSGVRIPTGGCSRLEKDSCESLPAYADLNGGNASDDATEQTQLLLQLLGRTGAANIVVEAIPSNPRSGEPAISFLKTSIQSKLNVVSANKGPVAHSILEPVENGKFERKEAYFTLKKLAMENKVMYLHESAVMDGVPIFSFWNYTMPRAQLLSIRGCLNSTTTMILTRMEGQMDGEDQGAYTGESFDDALSAAKKMGIVEENESLDVDGYDAAIKLRSILVFVSSHSSSSSSQSCKITIPPIDEIPRDSIRNVTHEDIHRAYSDGRKKFRLVASASISELEPLNNEEHASKTWNARVKLEMLTPDDPLYILSGTSSLVEFSTDVLGPISIVSKDPTLVDTSYGLFSDIIRIASESR
mmetsp:Transcript_15374/g.30823  ORF Transcript_15374/g.30823 Transcript_15374/m.30823 type:complete len:468 (-) Transcript_15374:17-1420(-)